MEAFSAGVQSWAENFLSFTSARSRTAIRLQDGDSHLQAFDELLQVFIGPQDFRQDGVSSYSVRWVAGPTLTAQRVRHLSLLAHLVQFLTRAGKLAAFSSATISSPRPTSRTRWRDYRTPKRPQKSTRGAISVTFWAPFTVAKAYCCKLAL